MYKLVCTIGTTIFYPRTMFRYSISLMLNSTAQALNRLLNIRNCEGVLKTYTRIFERFMSQIYKFSSYGSAL